MIKYIMDKIEVSSEKMELLHIDTDKHKYDENESNDYDFVCSIYYDINIRYENENSLDQINNDNDATDASETTQLTSNDDDDQPFSNMFHKKYFQMNLFSHIMLQVLMLQFC